MLPPFSGSDPLARADSASWRRASSEAATDRSHRPATTEFFARLPAVFPPSRLQPDGADAFGMKFLALRSDIRLGFSTPVASALSANSLLADTDERGVSSISDLCLPICGNRKVATSPILLFYIRRQAKMGFVQWSLPNVPICGQASFWPNRFWFRSATEFA